VDVAERASEVHWSAASIHGARVIAMSSAPEAPVHSDLSSTDISPTKTTSAYQADLTAQRWTEAPPRTAPPTWWSSALHESHVTWPSWFTSLRNSRWSTHRLIVIATHYTTDQHHHNITVITVSLYHSIRPELY